MSKPDPHDGMQMDLDGMCSSIQQKDILVRSCNGAGAEGYERLSNAHAFRHGLGTWGTAAWATSLHAFQESIDTAVAKIIYNDGLFLPCLTAAICAAFSVDPARPYVNLPRFVGLRSYLEKAVAPDLYAAALTNIVEHGQILGVIAGQMAAWHGNYAAPGGQHPDRIEATIKGFIMTELVHQVKHNMSGSTQLKNFKLKEDSTHAKLRVRLEEELKTL